MTNQHPITPPPELVAKWASSMCGYYEAARWGADMELEACCQWLFENDYDVAPVCLRAARRPNPPSLKQQALETLRSMQIDPVVINGVNVNAEVMAKYDTIRRALEQL